ncbi:MAG: hypothetical protein Q7R96_06345 [Nanoarchaeota archaeon]|nr:hypothetical protein [Nanoarchaeota archaeon]
MKTVLLEQLDTLRKTWQQSGKRATLEEVATRLKSLGYKVEQFASEWKGIPGTALSWSQGKGKPYQEDYQLFYTATGALELADAGRYGQMYRMACGTFTEERATWKGMGTISAFITLEKQLEFPLFIDGLHSGGVGQ